MNFFLGIVVGVVISALVVLGVVIWFVNDVTKRL